MFDQGPFLLVYAKETEYHDMDVRMDDECDGIDNEHLIYTATTTATTTMTATTPTSLSSDVEMDGNKDESEQEESARSTTL